MDGFIFLEKVASLKIVLIEIKCKDYVQPRHADNTICDNEYS